MHPLVEKVHRYIQDHHLLQFPPRVLVGVSGGADSVALLLALLELVRAGKLDIELFVAHLEHGIRGEQSQKDAEFVCELAKKLDLPIFIEAVDVPALAAERKLCLESAGRLARYDFFSRAAEQQQCSAVALAHHADDQVETILHRITRGTGLTGLAGIKPRRLLCRQPEIHIVRPLLSCHRVRIEEFLADRSVSWRTDHTNLGLDATRSRIRNELLRLLREKYNPRVNEALLKLAKIAEQTNDFLDEHTVELFDRVARTLGSLVCIDLPGLAKSHRALQAAIIRRAWLKLDLPQRDMSFDTIE
ncbi:MAG: tRNA lysidine(34) synthetase TilS, partial [Actinobacteria bacterium]|nr:tRNA lysidine(34) synthetase TilS [Actinomycetota bacterium]